jgi:signal transduction histidine kinase
VTRLNPTPLHRGSRSTCDLVGTLRSALTTRYSDLEALAEELEHLDPAELARVNEASAQVRTPFAALHENASRTGTLGPAERADLRTLSRRMRRVIALTAGASEDEGMPEPGSLDVHYAAVDIAARTRAACSAFAALAARRRIRFDVGLPETQLAEVDPLKYEICLVNLLFNAFKYTPEGGRIACSLAPSAQGRALVLSVTDTGPGVPPRQSQQLFDSARQLDRNVFLTVHGLGFNLGRSRDLVELHGGTLALSRSPDSGAMFFACLPAHAPRGMEVVTTAPPDSGLPERVAERAARELEIESGLGAEVVVRDDRPLVLLVEDSRSLQRIVIDCLGSEYNALSAFDGCAGLKLAGELRPDLVIADVTVPIMDGESMVREMRVRPELDDMPILVLTAADDPDQTVRLLRSGVQEVVRKPILLAEVRARVHNLIAAKRARDVLNELLGRHESDLERLAADVSKKQHALQRALEEVRVARELAESASSMKSNFLRMVSHELKTPIAAIELHLRLLERSGVVPAEGRLRDGFGSVSRCTRRLLQLVETILEWARIDSGRCSLSVEEIDLATLVDGVMSELAAHAIQKGIVVKTEAPPAPLPPLASDPRLVRLILLNLVGRAIQVSDEGSVRVAIDRDRDRHLVSVIDGAPPLRGPQRHDLFEPLRPERDLRSQAGAGSGLGLYVIRDLARAIDGDIAFEEMEGAGNCLRLSMPPLQSSLQRVDPRALPPGGKR